MTYREQITPWIVVRLLPSMQSVILARFKKRSDADRYAQALRQLDFKMQVVVVFDSGKSEAPFPQNRPAKLSQDRLS